MKPQPLALTFALLTVGSTLAMMPIESAPAQSSARFFCGRDAQGAPATVVEPANKSRRPVVLIRWKSKFFNGAGYTPQTRCAIVSKKFQDAYAKNPNFVFTTTIANGESVICSADSRGGTCNTLLYTIKRGYQDPILTMLRLEQTRAGASGALNESSSGSSTVEPAYVGVQDLIANVSADDVKTTPAVAPPKSILPKSTAVKHFGPTSSPMQVPSVAPNALW
jgi:Circadian oscillating protein COP23